MIKENDMAFLKKIIKLEVSHIAWIDYPFVAKISVKFIGIELWCVYVKSQYRYTIITDIGTFKENESKTI